MGNIYEVIVIGLNGENMTIDCTEEQMNAMTVVNYVASLLDNLMTY